jgi:hypothetical protein
LPDTTGTIKLQYHAANNAARGGGDNNNNNDEGVPKKTLVTSMIRRKTDAANADISEGGVLNRPTTKVGQYLSLTFEALPRPEVAVTEVAEFGDESKERHPLNCAGAQLCHCGCR